MKNAFFILVICLLLTAQSAFAVNEPLNKVSLQEAIDITLKEHPENAMAKINVDISKKEIKIANKLNNPNIYWLQSQGKAGHANTQEVGMTYQVPILKRIFLKKIATANEISADNAQKFKENELTYQVKEAYFNLLNKKAYLNIMNIQKNIAKEILDNINKEYKSGKVTETDVVLAKIEYNNNVMSQKEAELAVISARNALNSIMHTNSVDYDTNTDTWSENYSSLLTINPLDESVKFEDIKNYTFAHRHDLQSAQANIDSAYANLSAIKSQLIPDLGLKAGWLYYRPEVSDSGRLENGVSMEASLVNIPLVYHFKPEIEKARLEINKAELAYKDLEIDITRELREVWEAYLAAKNNLNFYNKELMANSEELEKVSLNNLKKNKITMTEYLVAKQKYLELLINYNEAFKNYHICYARLLKEIDVYDINEIKAENL